MRKRSLTVLGIAVLLGGGVAAMSAAGESGDARSAAQGVKGKFSLVLMAHTTSSTFGDLRGANAWDGSNRAGKTTYRYRSIACTGNAPVNNIASDLPSYNTRVKQSRTPSSMRAHPLAFRVKKVDGKRVLRGRLTMTVCHLRPGPTPEDDPVPDERKPKIKVAFNAHFKRETVESVPWAGKFKIRGGTGRYEDLAGSGRIAGYFFCFAPDGCAEKGKKYLDGQFVMQGRYEDPTPDLAAR